MPKKTSNSNRDGHRAQIIATVQTPLGFFVLVVLVVEAILGVVAGLTAVAHQVLVIWGMLVIIVALVALVGFLAYHRPEALRGMRPSDGKVTEPPLPSLVVTERHKVDRVICVSTEDHDHLEFDKDEEILRRHYRNIVVLRKASLDGFRKQLSSNRFEIVHILGFVHPQSGEMRFSKSELLSPNGLLKLLELCGAKLAFLSTCDSLFLAARLAPKVNVVAASGKVLTKDMISWEECFYDLLARGHLLSEAYAVAQETTDVPMVLLIKRDSVLAPSN